MMTKYYRYVLSQLEVCVHLLSIIIIFLYRSLGINTSVLAKLN